MSLHTHKKVQNKLYVMIVFVDFSSAPAHLLLGLSGRICVVWDNQHCDTFAFPKA